MAKAKNELGNKFGRLTVVEQIGAKSICKCDCGNEHITYTHNLRKLNTTQCKKCYYISISKRKTTHGQSNYQNSKYKKQTKEYSAWYSMKRRCYNENDKRYSDYGGRGIRVCDEWKNDFIAFFNYMGKAPTSKHQIDRIDNNKGYSPYNCRWVSQTENANNKRNNVMITINGKTLSASQWSIISGVKPATILKRKHSGYSDYDCVYKSTKDRSKVRISTEDGLFSGYKECAEFYNMSLSGINTRINSSAFPNWIMV